MKQEQLGVLKKDDMGNYIEDEEEDQIEHEP